MRFEMQWFQQLLPSQHIWRGRILIALAMLIFVSAAVSPIRGSTAASSSATPLKIGFIMVGPVNDLGWNYAHEQGRLYVQSALGKKVETTVAENVPANAEAERVMEKLIASGNKLIFTTSYGLLEPALRVAKRHPEITFMHLARPNPNPIKNLGTALCYLHEPVYIAGMVTGRTTKTNRIGFIAAHPVPQVLQNINALTLGARSVNPKATVRVVWTNNWSDPPTEAEAAKGLIDTGVDVVAMQQNSPATIIQIVEKSSLYSVGFHTDLSSLAPKGWLTGERWNWGPLYLKVVKSVMNHTWKPTNERYGMKDGYVTISPFGAAVSAKVRQEALAMKKRITNGEFSIFRGPLVDDNGRERVPKGQRLSQEQFDTMNWFVSGVEGTLPKK